MRTKFNRTVMLTSLVTLAALTVITIVAEARPQKKKFEISKIYFEFNSSGNDLGVHVFLDGEDWKELTITNPKGLEIFEVECGGAYKKLGMTELFFEGAEPSLDDVPLKELLAMFPKGKYSFFGKTVEGQTIVGKGTLSYAIPAGPEVSSEIANNSLVIRWEPVTEPPEGFPDENIEVVAYQVIVGSFQVTVPATTLSVTVSPEYVASLPPGEHEFEVLAIEKSGNQSITEDSFVKE